MAFLDGTGGRSGSGGGSAQSGAVLEQGATTRQIEYRAATPDKDLPGSAGGTNYTSVYRFIIASSGPQSALGGSAGNFRIITRVPTGGESAGTVVYDSTTKTVSIIVASGGTALNGFTGGLTTLLGTALPGLSGILTSAGSEEGIDAPPHGTIANVNPGVTVIFSGGQDRSSEAVPADPSKGLFISGAEADPSWHLRGVERQLEELAVLSRFRFPGTGSGYLDLTLPDFSGGPLLQTPLDDGLLEGSPEWMQRETLILLEDEDPPESEVKASAQVTPSLLVRATTDVGVLGNILRARVLEGRHAVVARDAGTTHNRQGQGFIYLSSTNAQGNTVNDSIFVPVPHAHAAGNGVEVAVVAGTVNTPGASARLRLVDGNSGTECVEVNFPEGAEHNGVKVVTSDPITVDAVAASGRLSFGLNDIAGVDVAYYQAGVAGNNFTITLSYASGVTAGTVEANYTSDTVLALTTSGSINGPAVAAAINAARRNNVQLITASNPSNSGISVAFSNAARNSTVTLSGGVAGGSTPQGAAWDADSRTLTITRVGNISANNAVTFINAVSAFPGTASVFSGRSSLIIRVPQTQTASGGRDAVAGTSGTVVWDTDGGTAGVGRLTIRTDGTLTVADTIIAINATPFDEERGVPAASVNNLYATFPVRIQSHVFSGGVDAVPRTPLAVAQESLAFGTPSQNYATLSITGVLPGVDTIAQARTVYAASQSTGRAFELVGTGTDAISNAAHSDFEHVLFYDFLTGGADAEPRTNMVHTNTPFTSNWFAQLGQFNITARVAPGHPNNATLQELYDFLLTVRFSTWRPDREAFQGFQQITAGDMTLVNGSEPIEITGNSIRNYQFRPFGGSNYIPPSPIEFLVRGEDEADGENIEVRYHHEHDTLREIFDASLISAQNPGRAEVVEIYGTDLDAPPEAPPVTKAMYPEVGSVEGGGSGVDATARVAAAAAQATANAASTAAVTAQTTANTKLTEEQVLDAVAAFLRQGTNITIVHDDDNNTLTISSTATGGGTPYTDEQVRDVVGVFVRGGTDITVTHDDDNDTLTIGYRQGFNDNPTLLADGAIIAQAPVFWTGNQAQPTAKSTAFPSNFNPSAIAVAAASSGASVQVMREGALNNVWVGIDRDLGSVPYPVYYQSAAQKLPDHEIYDGQNFVQSSTPATYWTTDVARASIPHAVGIVVGVVGGDVPGSGGDYAARCEVVFNFNHISPYNDLLPAATESRRGAVRNVSVDEAANINGRVFFAWSGSMLTKLMAIFRSNITQAEAEAGTSTNLRWWSALGVRQAINAVVPAVFRTGNTDRISGAKLGSGTRDGSKFLRDDNVWADVSDEISGALMEELYNAHTDAVSIERRIGTFLVPDDGNVVLLVSINGNVQFFAGDDFVALRESDGTTLDGVTLYSNTNRHFLIKQPTNASRVLRIWIVEDVEAFAAISARFLPTVTQADAEAGTSTQRRVWNALRVRQTIEANRNPRAFTGVTEASGELTFTRQGGTDPVDVPISGAGGAFELRPLAPTISVDFTTNWVATGVTIPELDDDEPLYLRIFSPTDQSDVLPQYFTMRGAFWKSITVGTAETAPAGTYYQRAEPLGATSFQIGRTAANEVLVASDDYDGTSGTLDIYTVSVGQGGSLGMIPLGSTNFNVTVGNTITPPNTGQPNIDLSSILDDDVLGVKVDFAQSDTTFDDIRLIDASTLLSKNSGTTLSSAEQAKPTLGGVSAFVGPNLWLSKDSDGNLAVATSGVLIDPMPISIWRFGRATAVAANPAGADGATLQRLRVQGRNYNIPGASVISALKINLTDVTDQAVTQAYADAIFNPTLTGARWNIGGFTLDSRKIVIPAAGMYQIHSELLLESGGGRQTFYTRYRIERNGAVIPQSVSEGTSYHRGASPNNEAIVEHDDWHLLQAGDKLLIDFKIGSTGTRSQNYDLDGSRSLIVLVGFQPPAGVTPTPSAHNRYIGWALAQNPTAAEFGTFTTETDDTLDVPTLPAAFTAAGGAFLVIAVPKTQGQPTGFYRSGNPINVIGAWDRVNDWTPTNSTAHYVYATEVAQSASSLTGASYRIEYGGSA